MKAKFLTIGGLLLGLGAACGVEPHGECSDCGGSAEAGASSNGAGTTSGGTTPGGSPAIGGASNGGDTASMAGAPPTAGDGSTAGDDQGGAAGSDGAGGAADGLSCHVNGQCGTATKCVGTHAARRCVEASIYCETDQQCVNSAGCVEHTCAPALTLGAPCTKDEECDRNAYCGEAGECVERTLDFFAYCDLATPSLCREGNVCRWEWSSNLFRCMLPYATVGQHGCGGSVPCSDDAWCDPYAFNPISECKRYTEPGSRCQQDAECTPGFRCGIQSPGQNFNICIALPAAGEPCPAAPYTCAKGFCGTDALCHDYAKQLQDCSTLPCDKNLRCADIVTDGSCTEPPSDDPCQPNPCENGATCHVVGYAAAVCACPSTRYEGERCELDTLDCTNDNGGCDHLTTCTPTAQGRTCSACPDGYLGTGETGCVVDHCYDDNGGCDPLVLCTSTESGRTCGACPAGSTGSGETSCVVDHCYDNNGGCDSLTHCTNTATGRTCSACPLGYTGTGETGCTGLPFTSVVAGRQRTCAVRSNGVMQCWGDYAGTSAADKAFKSANTMDDGVACGLQTNGVPWCWGAPDFSDLIAKTPTMPFSSLSGGAGAYLCALAANGAATCWGNAPYGETNAPADLFASISAGYIHVCGLLPSGGVKCWGDNTYGESTVPANTSFSAVSSGSLHTCGLTTTGVAVCWGSNADGQSAAPVGDTFTSISAGHRHTCALKANGEVKCWGWNSYGQSTAPSEIGFVQVSAGSWHNCARRSNGTLKCWGEAVHGESTPPK